MWLRACAKDVPLREHILVREHILWLREGPVALVAACVCTGCAPGGREGGREEALFSLSLSLSLSLSIYLSRSLSPTNADNEGHGRGRRHRALTKQNVFSVECVLCRMCSLCKKAGDIAHSHQKSLAKTAEIVLLPHTSGLPTTAI